MSSAFYLTVGVCALLILTVGGYFIIQALRLMVRDNCHDDEQ